MNNVKLKETFHSSSFLLGPDPLCTGLNSFVEKMKMISKRAHFHKRLISNDRKSNDCILQQLKTYNEASMSALAVMLGVYNSFEYPNLSLGRLKNFQSFIDRNQLLIPGRFQTYWSKSVGHLTHLNWNMVNWE